MARPDNCATCGRARKGIERRRQSWSPDLGTVAIPRRTDESDGTPWQQHNTLIVYASVYRGGGASEDTHLCDGCLTIGLRELKLAIDRALDETDASTDMTAAIADLTQRLARVQFHFRQAVFEHNRMQERLAAVVDHPADAEVVDAARFEIARGPLRVREFPEDR